MRFLHELHDAIEDRRSVLDRPSVGGAERRDFLKGRGIMIKPKENSGKHIQGIATVILVVGILFSLLSANFIGHVAYEMTDMETGGRILLIAILLTAGIALSWVLSQLVRGFGELVEYTAESSAYLEAMYEKTNENEKKD